MTVTVQTPVNSYTANGVTTVFNFTFLLLAYADLDVYVDDVLKTFGVDYTVSGLENNAGGTVTFTTAPANGANVVLQRNSDIARATDYQHNGDMLAAVVNKDFDRLWLAMQEILYKYQLAPSLVPGSPLAGGIRLPSPEVGKYLRWNIDEDNLENGDPDFYRGTILPDGALIATAADIAITPMQDGQIFELVEYHAGTGKGGRLLKCFAGSITPDNVLTFNGPTGFYLQSINIEQITPELGGCKLDGSDDSTAFQRVVNLGLGILHDSGTLKINSPITSTSNLIISGSGYIDASAVAGSALKCSGTLTSLPDISTVSAGSDTVIFASAHGLSVGDVFVIYNPTDSSYSGFRTYYRAGEFCEVREVTGLTVKLRNQLYAGYTGASVDLYRLSSGIVLIDGVTISGSATPIEITKCLNPVVKNVKVTNANNSSIYFDKCYSPVGYDLKVRNAGNGGDDYGVIFGNCQHGKISMSDIYSRRHAVATGGDSEIGCVPCRDIRITKSTLKNNYDDGIHCADFHGNTEDSSYENCTIYGGVSWQGKNNFYRSCKIYAMDIGTVEYAAEILGGNFGIIDCDLYTNVDPSAVSRGVIDVGGGNDALTTNTTSNCTFVVKDCRINGSNLSNITSLMRVRVAGSTVKINVDFNGNNIDVNDMGSPVLAGVTSGSTSPDYIIVDNNSGIASGKLLANLTGGFAGAPMRMQSCSGSVQGTTSTSAPSVNVDVVFRYAYPKVPVVNVTKSLRNYNGNRIGVAVNYIPLTTGTKLGLYTDDATNFSAAQTFDFNWTAGINEI